MKVVDCSLECDALELARRAVFAKLYGLTSQETNIHTHRRDTLRISANIILT